MTERVGKIKKLLRKLACVVLFVCIGFAIPTSETYADDWGGRKIELYDGWTMIIHSPRHCQNENKYHAHIYYNSTFVCAESVDGTPSHGKTFDDCFKRGKLPRKVVNMARNHPAYERAAEKQALQRGETRRGGNEAGTASGSAEPGGHTG